jgi:hypothetical protein
MEEAAGDGYGGTSSQSPGGHGNNGGASIHIDTIPLGGRMSTWDESDTSSCPVSSVEDTLFGDQVFQAGAAFPRVFYSWTTEEQAEEIRRGNALFSRSERPELGRGNALTALDAFGASDGGTSGKLAAVLSQQLFFRARYTWTNPWATRMGWRNERYGSQLIRIELKPEAWHAVFDGRLTVFDEAGKYVEPERALTEATRIGAILFLRTGITGGPQCSTLGPFYDSSGQPLGGVGYREVVLGNLGMVKQYSLGTVDMRNRITDDISRLRRFEAALRTCPPLERDPDWNSYVSCGWTSELMSPSSSAYVNSLAFPNDYYYPTADNLRYIVDSLERDGFQLDPFVVSVY